MLAAVVQTSVEVKVSILEVVPLWGDYRDIPTDQGVMVTDMCYVPLFEDFLLKE